MRGHYTDFQKCFFSEEGSLVAVKPETGIRCSLPLMHLGKSHLNKKFLSQVLIINVNKNGVNEKKLSTGLYIFSVLKMTLLGDKLLG